MGSSLRGYFSALDRSGDGRISEDELRMALRAGDLDVSEEFLAELLRECDRDSDGGINFLEFVEAYARQTRFAGLDLGKAASEADWGPRLYGLVLKARWVVLAIAMAMLGSLIALLVVRPEAQWPMHLWAATAGVLAAVAVAAAMHPGVRVAWGLLTRGLNSFNAAIHGVLRLEQPFTRLLGERFGKPVLYIHDEQLVAQVLRRPQHFVRLPMTNYPPFEQFSELGAGSGEEWLKYRIAFKDYFASGYRSDLDELRAIVAERIPAWIEAGEVRLLSELFRILVEIRGRLFFQASFDCYSPTARPNFADEVDEVLSPPVLFFGSGGGGTVDLFHARILTAIHGSTRPDSVGGICRAKLESGEWTEEEALQNGSLFMLAHAPTVVLFWALYRTARDGTGGALRSSRKRLLQSLKEELRIHPGVHLLLPRMAKGTHTLGPLQIPDGATLLVSPFVVQNSPRHWQDPERFDPECWDIAEDDDPRVLTEVNTDPKDVRRRPSACPFHQLMSGADEKRGGRSRFLPFGGGQHQCQGRWFAADEMFAVMQTILSRVELEVAPGQPDLLGMPVWERLSLHVYGRPIRDITLRVRARASA